MSNIEVDIATLSANFKTMKESRESDVKELKDMLKEISTKLDSKVSMVLFLFVCWTITACLSFFLLAHIEIVTQIQAFQSLEEIRHEANIK